MSVPRRRPPSKLKTFSHLAKARRMPSEYELVTTRLTPHLERQALEVLTPIDDWYTRHLRRSAFRVDDWEPFADPRRTTYPTYTSLQRDREAHVEALFDTIERTDYDARLGDEARRLLERTIPVLRFPIHGLQMLAAYLGQMAPSARVTVVAAMQTTDEIRRIQHFARRMHQLARTIPGFGAHSRQTWQKDVNWQPLREVVERALVAYDWSESFVATCLCIKPLFDEVCNVHMSVAAERVHDAFLSAILHSIHLDAEWHRDWSAALVRFAVGARPENRAVLEAFVAVWAPRALTAMTGIDAVIERTDGPDGNEADTVLRRRRLASFLERHLESMGLASAVRS